MKKIPKIIKTILLAAIIGFFISILIHNGMIYKIRLGSKMIPWYLYFIIYILNFVLIILIHELGHLFSFVFSKIKIKALFVLIFILKKDERWHFQIRFKNIKLIGGLVVPNLPPITNEEEYQNLKEKFAKALITGPIVSIVYFAMITILFCLLWILSNNYLLITIIFHLFILTLLMTILIHHSSKLNTKNLYGDYVAYQKFKEEKFSLLQIVQYLGFSSLTNKETEQFVYNKLEDYFKNNQPAYDLFSLALTSHYLNSFITLNKTNNETIVKVIKYYHINSLKSKSEGLELVYLISAYHYYVGDVEKAYQIFNSLSNQEFKHTSLDKLMLLKLQYEHFLNLANNHLLIKQQKENIIKELDILEPIFDIDSYIESLLQQLKYQEYSFKYVTILDDINN